MQPHLYSQHKYYSNNVFMIMTCIYLSHKFKIHRSLFWVCLKSLCEVVIVIVKNISIERIMEYSVDDFLMSAAYGNYNNYYDEPCKHNCV